LRMSKSASTRAALGYPIPWRARHRAPCLPGTCMPLPCLVQRGLGFVRLPRMRTPFLFLVGPCFEPISTIPISTRNRLSVTFPDLPRITPVTDLPRAFWHLTAIPIPARISIRALPIHTRIRHAASFLHCASRVSPCAPYSSSSTPMPTRYRPSPASHSCAHAHAPSQLASLRMCCRVNPRLTGPRPSPAYTLPVSPARSARPSPTAPRVPPTPAAYSPTAHPRVPSAAPRSSHAQGAPSLVAPLRHARLRQCAYSRPFLIRPFLRPN
ncbi:Unknown protein, partial [Striga hermonthica]